VITSPHNQHLKTIRRLRRKRERERSGLLLAEGEDLVEAAAAAGFKPEVLLRAGVDVEPGLLEEASTLGSGTRVAGVYRQRWSQPGGRLSVYLHQVRDPGNVGTVIRCAHAFCDGPVTLGPGCADPWSPKAVRASMGSAFARPPARGGPEELEGSLVALDRSAERELGDLRFEPPVVLCLGSERSGLPPELLGRATERVRIGLRAAGPESLNVAVAGAIALYQAATRMADRA
jgi:TrmH family RNA methyltransferase